MQAKQETSMKFYECWATSPEPGAILPSIMPTGIVCWQCCRCCAEMRMPHCRAGAG